MELPNKRLLSSNKTDMPSKDLAQYGVSPHDLPVCVQDSCGESCIVDYEIKNNKG